VDGSDFPSFPYRPTVGIIQKHKSSFIPVPTGSEGNIPLFFQETNVLGTVVLGTVVVAQRENRLPPRCNEQSTSSNELKVQ